MRSLSFAESRLRLAFIVFFLILIPTKVRPDFLPFPLEFPNLQL